MRLVDASGNPLSSGKNEVLNDEYAPEFLGSVFGLANKITQKLEATFLFLSEPKLLSSFSESQQTQAALMSIVASYAALTYAVKIKKMTQEQFQQEDPNKIKDELLTKFDIVNLGTVPFDTLFELNPETLAQMSEDLPQVGKE